MKNSVLRSLVLFVGAILVMAYLALSAGNSNKSASRVQAAEKHPFAFDDYAALRSARAVAVSADGKTILYRVSFVGNAGPADKHEWHLIDATGANSRKLDLPEHFEPSGFTKDGAALYGTLPVGKSAGLAIVPFSEGRAIQIVALPSGIRGAIISPDGARFAVLADPRKADPLEGVHTIVENDETSLYVVDADGANGGWWCPQLMDITDVAWSPDGSQIAVVTQWQKIGHHDVKAFIDVCGRSGARRVAEIPDTTAGIAWTKSGAELAFTATTTPTLTPEHVWTVPVSGGKPIDRTPDLAGTAATLTGDASGNVWVETHKGVITEVNRFADGKLTTAFSYPGGIVNGLPAYSSFVASNTALAFSVADPSHSTNVAVANGAELRKITNEGDDTLAGTNLGDVKTVHWTSKEGIKLEGIATFPPGYVTGKKYPFLVFPHGGPEANDQLEFDAFAQYIAGLGYVVLQPEYRGSTGYGADFLSAIYQHFGDRAYRDVDSATDFAIEQGWADPNRLAIFGWSAGGFMTSWTVTQTQRYKAAIEGAGITDWLSFIPTSDTWQVDYDARMQEKDPAPMLQYSAVMYVDKVTTPLLILHGEADVRVPTFQGREYYVLLAERGKTVRMVTYPGSPHFPRLAEQRLDVFKELGEWLKKYNP
jgi:dipeptidyl aminopeptidase/acylaminoacyl peptidase